ncbi:hypothetical protein QJS04_geneDACA017765 [Acorus gramineus]|uniref:Acid phosphatase/vanadium-dependent haloperoxidase-related protein n=1 Tax=Acorus gramineus TaxID=55184 RepID=A0AAV8ZXX2_ACOGR|nr:hypothetical protein QJS04_geneDACA017765 [Acorus gramineus]
MSLLTFPSPFLRIPNRPKPIPQSVKTLSITSSHRKPSLLRSASDFALSCLSPLINGGSNGDQYMHSGGFGVVAAAVLGGTRVHNGIGPFVAALMANPTFVSGALAWAVAQSMKVMFNFLLERRWDLGMLFSSGGMPSSHSALCMALTASVGIRHGPSDSLFPVCLCFSLIVMYDATGVRRHAGMQAEVLNKIIEDLFQGHPISQRKLKELLGHTPSQVIAGALLGIIIACFCCQGSLVAF